ncbi:cupin domain-containing protein [Photobacterium sp. CCB-ST2H9]|uniref:cupin domain-containing protein n=1 Tax=Photobacterium sp. CCB-ST2H9 TaxID=2912855 RepID=UPI0020043A00|nr:cupin domain-containing protein [Photobacterium sp. CCB-ST2H9]UTM59263.1 cupin domain-containing protein [Photobacterium sp. CCB-ST2H9]
MEMKEFYYQDGIRVSLFNLDHEAVPYHFHQSVSDMIYCSKGTIRIELPELEKLFIVPQGKVFQIPAQVKHRFANGAPEGVASRYVLMQLGHFDIEFVKDTRAMQALLSETGPQNGDEKPVYIEDRKADILALADHFTQHKPEVLTDEENRDVVTALRYFAEQGIAAIYPLMPEEIV